MIVSLIIDKKLPNYLELTENLPIFAPSEHLFWLSGQNPEVAGLFGDTASGARHHDNYSI